MSSKLNIIDRLLKEIIADEKGNIEVSDGPTSPKPSPDSVDAQIDGYIIGAEKSGLESAASDIGSSIGGPGMNEAIRFSMVDLLLEAPEDEEDPAPAEEEVEEEDVEPEIAGKEDIAAEEPATPEIPSINIDVFSEKIAILAENFSSRLDIPGVIFNRAKNYLEENYTKDHVLEMIDRLEQLGFAIDREKEVPERPLAVGAGGPGGGLGGGGG